MLPAFSGQPIRVELRRPLGPHLAASSMKRRVILLDPAVLDGRGEFERILIHEIFHFAWLRLGNRARRDWEQLLCREIRARARGELGWSAEWRKTKLRESDIAGRSPAWRRYICESFCDTAAWRFAGLRRHAEFTLPRRFCGARRRWFDAAFSPSRTIPL
ncbi:MAG TPA: hypothetical protein VKX39_08560 [Bryobacteraceae bacterium]|nr:hypothetical protein [Bryobacteraceae bacterium]